MELAASSMLSSLMWKLSDLNNNYTASQNYCNNLFCAIYLNSACASVGHFYLSYLKIKNICVNGASLRKQLFKLQTDSLKRFVSFLSFSRSRGYGRFVQVVLLIILFLYIVS